MTDTPSNISPTTDLQVRGESIQSIYSKYLHENFLVNRRYQRKLVWATPEKRSFIESISKNLPIPLLLFAEAEGDKSSRLEVLDGMQRINAIVSFIENEFALDEKYFDLESLADTKDLFDKGILKQKTPKLDRSISRRIANYQAPISIFRPTDTHEVDEAFRRINSGGRHLSRQELRQAGTLSSVSELVRTISSKIRGDVTPGDILPLNKMPSISLSIQDLDYGVNADDMFWVKHGVLRRDDVRGSQDEQVILDLIADCVMHPRTKLSADVRDDYYGFTDAREGNTFHKTRLEAGLDVYNTDILEKNFMHVMEVLKQITEKNSVRLASHMGISSGGRSPRYFHALFMAVFELMHQDNMRISNIAGFLECIKGAANTYLNIPGGSGTWTADDRETAINSVKGVIRASFEKMPQDATHELSGAIRIENILGEALVEVQNFECKQGFLPLEGSTRFQSNVAAKIVKTLTAMSNIGPRQQSHILIGIADKKEDAKFIQESQGIQIAEYRGFHIVGMEREAHALGESLSDYWDRILRSLKDVNSVPTAYGQEIAHLARIFQYQGLRVGVLSAPQVQDPVFFGDSVYTRNGSSTEKVGPPDMGNIYRRFYA